MYKFKDDKKYYTCTVTYQQYKNFRDLPIIKECKVIKKNQKNVQEYKEEMEKALHFAVKNDKSHIKRLSKNL